MRFMLPFRLGITGLALLMWALRPACADQYALLIGIDDYKDRNHINSLGAAAADAKAMAKTLHEVCGFSDNHIRLLTSDGDNKPERNNILYELDQLHKHAKPDDTIILFYSGHGMLLDGESYLIPYDADLRSDLTLRESTLQAKKLTDELNKLPAKTLILIFDMCRSDPRKGEKAITPRNSLGAQQARRLQVVAHQDGSGPQTTLTLYSCSPQQSSWEWVKKGRGYFSYFFEQGLRREAADAQGTVRVKNLVSYLEKAVSGAVQREEGQDQTPYSLIDGAGVMDLVLASGRPPGNAGTTAVPVETGKTVEAQFDVAFQKGNELYTQKRYDAARVMFEQALELKPDSATALNGIGKTAVSVGDEAEAEKLFRQSMELDPKYFNPVNNLGVIYLGKKNYNEAERMLRKAMELAPTDARPVANLGTVYFNKEDYEQAEKFYRKAIELDPKNAVVVNGLGNVYFNKEDYEQAEKFYRQAMELDLKDAVPVNSLGNIYFKKEAYAQAEKFYRKAIELDPKQGMYHANLALVLLQQKRRVDAREEAQQAITLGYKGPHPVFDALNLKP